MHRRWCLTIKNELNSRHFLTSHGFLILDREINFKNMTVIIQIARKMMKLANWRAPCGEHHLQIMVDPPSPKSGKAEQQCKQEVMRIQCRPRPCKHDNVEMKKRAGDWQTQIALSKKRRYSSSSSDSESSFFWFALSINWRFFVVDLHDKNARWRWHVSNNNNLSK